MNDNERKDIAEAFNLGDSIGFEALIKLAPYDEKLLEVYEVNLSAVNSGKNPFDIEGYYEQKMEVLNKYGIEV